MQSESFEDLLAEYRQLAEKHRSEAEKYKIAADLLQKKIDEREKEKVVPETPTKKKGTSATAREILKVAGKPLHGTRDIYPLLQHRGSKIKKGGLQSVLGRTKGIRKVEGVPNTWEYIDDAEPIAEKDKK